MNALHDGADIPVADGKLDEVSSWINQVTSLQSVRGSNPNGSLPLTIAKLAAARHQYAPAESEFHSILANGESLMSTKLSAGYELAKLFESQNDVAAAERAYKQTLAMYEAARTQIRS